MRSFTVRNLIVFVTSFLLAGAVNTGRTEDSQSTHPETGKTTPVPVPRTLDSTLDGLSQITTRLDVRLGVHFYKVVRQEQAVEAISNCGGWVHYDYQFDGKKVDAKAKSTIPDWLRNLFGADCFHTVVEVNFVYNDDFGKRLDNSNLTEAPLECLDALPKLRRLLLHGTQATDANLQHVAGLRELESLYIWNAASVTDAGMKNFKRLEHLKYIHLSKSQITDESLRMFGEMPNLEGLSLQGNHFSDKGMAHLVNLRSLQSLWVCGADQQNRNEITDEGLKQLHPLKNLQTLGVQHTKVTKDGVREFTERIPACKIYSE